ncbi:MAG: DUF4178 domain-containing protein [Pseudomonadota bacterium]
MQIVSCPSCGAQVEFKSHAAVMAVCEFCQATLMKELDAVKDIGKMSAVLEDYSQIQIGTSGKFGGRPFAVIGRIQLRWAAGMWNEWYLLFEDGSTSWLGDSSGLYTLTTERAMAGALPAFGDIMPGRRFSIGGSGYTASEVRNAECIGGQGELPFKVGQGWQAKVADFRNGSTFLTLDYSDADTPTVYTGVAVTLEELECQLLREDEAIKASAGKFKGKVSSLDCGACGSSIKYLPGLTSHLVCPACQAQIDAASPKAQVVAATERVDARPTSLELGASARINGQSYRVIGMLCRADDEGNEWTEYLLYSTRAAFFWLVETEEGWWKAAVMHTWPYWDWPGGQIATLDKANFNKLYDYTARVRYAAGAFNWRVAAGDTVHVTEFAGQQARLAAERTDEELTWSRSTPVAFDQLRAWFGPALKGEARPLAETEAKNWARPTTVLWWILGLNAIPLMLEFSHTLIYTLLAIAAIYLPMLFMSADSKRKK